jgi:uncharacterized protein (UPF0333 family)
MRGQLFLEFLVAFLAVALMVGMLSQSQNSGLQRLSSAMEQLKTKADVDRVASACNLLYLNWKTVDFRLSFNLSGYRTANNTITAESNASNLTSRCLSNVSFGDSMYVSGVKRWF